jgi:hypothetical protein
MDQNPYDAPKISTGGWSRGSASRRTSLHSIVALLVCVVMLQWICHFLTAVAMFSYMGAARVGPTAKTLDSVFYGFCCVGFTALLSVVAGILGMRALQRNDTTPKEP